MEVAEADDSSAIIDVSNGYSESIFPTVVNSVTRTGYCILQTSPVATEFDTERRSFTRPNVEFEEEYLGSGSNSKVEWLSQAKDSAFAECMQQVDDLCNILSPVTSMAFGFFSAPKAECKMLRKECISSRERQLLEKPPINDRDVQAGGVDQFLDFMWRRRLCFMYFVSVNTATVELAPKQAGGYPGAALQLAKGMILIFRHDLLNYAYSAEGQDLVLQAWLMQESQMPPVVSVSGPAQDVLQAVGAKGSALVSCEEAHMMSACSRHAANAKGLERSWNAYATSTDFFTEIPIDRWDHTPYYSDDHKPGTATSKHGSFLSAWDIFQFDHEMFKMSYDESAKLTNPMMATFEVSYQVLVEAGWDMDSIRGENLDIAIAPSGTRESDLVHKMTNSIDTTNTDHYLEQHLLANMYGIKGKHYFIDTACSASNVAVNLLYQDLRISRDHKSFYRRGGDLSNSTKGLAIALDFFTGPLGFVGLSQAHMVGKSGRPRTFDTTADGMQRGEGVLALYLCNNPNANGEQLVSIIGGAINQDGRSASLTAPNGPSQTKVLRQSLRDAGREPEDTSMTELHGTGTALGDPIETGSCRAVMFPRKVPLQHTSGKSHTGHTEMAAGLSGIIKTTISVVRAACPPNNHLYLLNPTIDQTDYSANWNTELVDLGIEMVHAGISSFGFGGTNARIDLWGCCKRGPRAVLSTLQTGSDVTTYITKGMGIGFSPHDRLNTSSIGGIEGTCAKCLGPMDWFSGEALFPGDDSRPRCSRVREDFSSYGICSLCYKGTYRADANVKSADAGDPYRRIYIRGASAYQEMQQSLDGEYVHVLRLGRGQSALFDIVLDRDPSLALYPILPKGDQDLRMVGPDAHAQGRKWLITADEAATYRITFKWEPKSRSLRWEKIESETEQPRYFLGGDWNNWSFNDELEAIPEATGRYSFELTLRDGHAEFQIAIDGDLGQVLHPSRRNMPLHRVGSSPAAGPDGHSLGLNWSVNGAAGSVMEICLDMSAEDGVPVVSCVKSSKS